MRGKRQWSSFFSSYGCEFLQNSLQLHRCSLRQDWNLVAVSGLLRYSNFFKNFGVDICTAAMIWCRQKQYFQFLWQKLHLQTKKILEAKFISLFVLLSRKFSGLLRQNKASIVIIITSKFMWLYGLKNWLLQNSLLKTSDDDWRTNLLEIVC